MAGLRWFFDLKRIDYSRKDFFGSSRILEGLKSNRRDGDELDQ